MLYQVAAELPAKQTKLFSGMLYAIFPKRRLFEVPFGKGRFPDGEGEIR